MSVTFFYCEDCGIEGCIEIKGIVEEITPKEASGLLEVLFHGAGAFHFVELSPTWGVRVARCTGRLETFLPIKIWLNADPHRNGPFGGYGVTVRMVGANV